ncbi:MAG: family protein phosphatase [Thermoleophilaceae bacterium]|nr:family protein phosphatase [Thermoleophilaceae bacterium]
MALRIVEKAALSDVGRQRQGNEDSFLERSPLFAVADGMGGARAGEVASRIAVEQFDVDGDADNPPEEQLAEVARGANRKIHTMAQEDSAYAGMGTTFTAALVTGKHIAIGHVGDSRLYRFRDGELERLTHDHSLVEEFVRQGKLTPAEAEVHPQRSIITRALGPEPEVEVDTYTHSGRDGDVYLLNSDGLTGMINEEKVAEILRDRESLEDAAEKLIAAANANGGKDNITVVLFRLGSDGDEPEEEDEEPGTLGGQATQVGVSAETVRKEIARAETTKARDVPEDVPPERLTQVRTKVLEEGTEPRSASRPQRAPPVHRRRRRRYVTAAIVLVVLAAVIAGLYALDRKFWFVGTNDRGQVTLFRGLPYDLPLGLELYTEEYQSAVPVAAISDKRQRTYVLDHHARSEGESISLVRDIERKYARR